jgi:acetyl esterase
MAELLERIERAGAPPLYTMSPPQARVAFQERSEVLDLPRAALARVEELSIPADDRTPLPARLYAARRDGALPVLLYLHGGGFVIGNLETHDSLCRQLALLSGAAVIALDYRLAPEHRFPTAVYDAWAALRWLASEGARSLGLDGNHLAVGGDSAGGTLATVCATLARDARLPVCLQLLFYPGCAGWPRTPSHARYHQGLVLEQAHIEYFFRKYIDDADRDDWRFAPLNTPDLHGVAPAWFGLAECDPLVDDGIAYADTLRAAGVAVELEIYRGVTHEFIKMGRALPEAVQAHADAAAALRRALQA